MLCVFSSRVSAEATDYTFNLTISNPVSTVSDLIFLYTQGDVLRDVMLTGSAAPGGATTFSVNETIDVTIPGTPMFSLIGLYSSTTSTGVAVAVNPTVGTSMVSGGATFDTAFPVFSGLFQPSESTLAQAIPNPNSAISAPGGGTLDAGFGYEIVDYFNSSSEYEATDPFTPLNLNGSTSASLLGFSNATSLATVDVSVVPQGGTSGTTGVPEPGSGGLLAMGMIALGTALTVKKVR